MLTGGKILVAAVGAVVLAVVAVFMIRAIWWSPASQNGPLTPATTTTTATTDSKTTTTTTSSDPSGGIGTGGTTGTDGSTGSDGTSGSSKSGQAEKYTATSKKVVRIFGRVAVDVELPQVTGGNPDVAKAFNDEMQSALQSQLGSVSSGTLESRDGSGVRIGEQVLSGLLRTAAVDTSTAESTALAGTVVMDTESGSVITLSSLFTNLDKGLKRLQAQTKEVGPSSNSSFDPSRVAATEAVFEHWTAESSGMRVYFKQGLVAPKSEGIVDVTIPWDKLKDLMKPGVAKIVSS
jgi:hypothetical protein